MDIIWGDIAIHIEKTNALMLCATPLVIVMQLPYIQKMFSGFFKLNKFRVNELKKDDDEEC